MFCGRRNSARRALRKVVDRHEVKGTLCVLKLKEASTGGAFTGLLRPRRLSEKVA